MWLARLIFIRNLSLMDREAMAFWANNLMGKVWCIPDNLFSAKF